VVCFCDDSFIRKEEFIGLLSKYQLLTEDSVLYGVAFQLKF
jgi:hypothetical protein